MSQDRKAVDRAAQLEALNQLHAGFDPTKITRSRRPRAAGVKAEVSKAGDSSSEDELSSSISSDDSPLLESSDSFIVSPDADASSPGAFIPPSDIKFETSSAKKKTPEDLAKANADFNKGYGVTPASSDTPASADAKSKVKFAVGVTKFRYNPNARIQPTSLGGMYKSIKRQLDSSSQPDSSPQPKGILKNAELFALKIQRQQLTDTIIQASMEEHITPVVAKGAINKLASLKVRMEQETITPLQLQNIKGDLTVLSNLADQLDATAAAPVASGSVSKASVSDAKSSIFESAQSFARQAAGMQRLTVDASTDHKQKVGGTEGSSSDSVDPDSDSMLVNGM